MQTPSHTSHRSAARCAAISIAAACVIGAQASAQVPASLLIGPDRVGSAVTYRLTTSGGSAPIVQTLALRWKLGQKVLVTLTSADDAQATPFVATRGADGTLTLDNWSASDPEGQRVAVAIGVLNRLNSFVSAAPAGAKTWKTTLVVQPSTQPLKIAVAVTRSDDATGTTLAASGSTDRTVTRPAGDDSPRSGGGGGTGGSGGMARHGGGMGGGMGGGGLGHSFGSGSGGKSTKMTSEITVDAHFGHDGELTSGTIVETNQTAGDQNQPSPQTQRSTRSWQIAQTP